MENEAQGINSDGKEVLTLSTGTARVMEMSWIHPKWEIAMGGHENWLGADEANVRLASFQS